MILPVAIRRMMKANKVAMVIPWKADEMKALSEGMKAQNMPAVYSADFMDSGALSLYSLT